MAIRARQIQLDAGGGATLVMAPGLLVAHQGSQTLGIPVPPCTYTITRQGAQIANGGTALTSVTRGNEVFVEGPLVVRGSPNEFVMAWFDFE